METNNIQVKFNLQKFIKLCLRYWYYFVASIVGICLLALAYLYIRKPAYEVDAQLMLPTETSGGGIMALSDIASSFSMGDIFGGSSTENEMMIMKSYSVFLKTAQDLGLNISYFEKEGFMKWMPAYDKSQLLVTADPAIADTLRAPILFRLKLNGNGTFDITAEAKKTKILVKDNVILPATLSTIYGDFTFSQTEYFGKGEDPATSFKVLYSSYGYAAETYNKAVKVFAPNKKADFIGLSYITTNPKFGKRLLNTIIDNYNLFGDIKNDDKNNRTLEFVNERIANLENDLAKTETSMEQFKKSNKLTNVDVDASTLLQKSSMLDASLLQAQTENEILSNTKEFLANPENKYSLIPSLTAGPDDASAATATVASDIATYNKQIMERMRVLRSAKVNNAMLKQIEELIDAMRENIQDAIDRAYENSLLKLNKLRTENNRTQQRMGSIPTLEKEYVGIERTLILQQQLYLFLLKQREEAEMSIAKSSPTLVTIDAPYTLSDTPGLSKAMVLMLAILLGGFIPLIFIYYTKMKETPITTVGELEELSKAPIIAKVDNIKDANGIIINDDATGETIRMLRSNLLFTLDEFNGKVIVVTSTLANEGKTFIACNLAASLAAIGKKTLIIDANFRNPQVASTFGLSNANGLAQVISNGANNADIQNSSVGNDYNLDVLAAGSLSGNPADLLSNESLTQSIEALKESYDLIVIDTAALKQYSDTFSLAECSDMTMMIVRMGTINATDIEYANALYNEGRLKRIGIVANGTKA